MNDEIFVEEVEDSVEAFLKELEENSPENQQKKELILTYNLNLNLSH